MFQDDIVILVNNIDNVSVYGVSGMDHNVLLSGRPYGGCAIIVNNSLPGQFEPLHINSRCHGGILKLSCDLSILIFNVYMPCDSTADLDNLEIFSSILSDVKSKCFELSHVNYVVLGGDFNTDMRRTGSLHTNALMSYVNDEGLAFSAQSDISDIKYIHESDVHNTCSTIDHFIVSDRFHNRIYVHTRWR